MESHQGFVPPVVMTMFIILCFALVGCAQNIPKEFETLLPDELGSERGALFEYRDRGYIELRKLTEEEELAIRYLASPNFFVEHDGPHDANRAGWPICKIDGVDFEFYGTGVLFLKEQSMDYRWEADDAGWQMNFRDHDNLDLSPLVEWYKQQRK